MKRILLPLLLLLALPALAQTFPYEIITPDGMMAASLEVHATRTGDYQLFTFKNVDRAVLKITLAIVPLDDKGNLRTAKTITPGVFGKFLFTPDIDGSFGFPLSASIGKVYFIVQRIETADGVYEWALPEGIEETAALLAGKTMKRATFTAKF